MTTEVPQDIFKLLGGRIDRHGKQYWPRRKPWVVLHRTLTDTKQQVRFAYQRVVRGWDDGAWWDLGTHLCHSLGAQLMKMYEECHGYPSHYTYEQWRAELKEHGEALLRYDAMDDPEDTHARLALYWVSDHLSDMWD